jgi:hypothetical protein
MTKHCIVQMVHILVCIPPGQVWLFNNADIVGHVLNLATSPIILGDLKFHIPESQWLVNSSICFFATTVK